MSARSPSLRIGFYGGGAMAQEIAEAVLANGHEVVACLDPVLPAGALGAVLVEDLAGLSAARPDVVVHATPRDSDLRGQLLELITSGLDTVSISGIANLKAADPAAAAALDEAARSKGVTVVGAGINPGFVLDIVPILFTTACVRVTRLTARRIADLTPYGDAVMSMYGIGLSVAEFQAGIDDGTIGLHREIVQSAHMLADALDIEVDEIVEEKLPIAEGDRVVGFRHICQARPGIELEMQLVFSPENGGSTTVEIEGDPDMAVTMTGGLSNQGGRVVAARILHTLRWMAQAPAGLRSATEVPLAFNGK
jgi:hypothetical protein